MTEQATKRDWAAEARAKSGFELGTPEYEAWIEKQMAARLDEEHPLDWFEEKYSIHHPDGRVVRYDGDWAEVHHPDGTVERNPRGQWRTGG